MSKTNIRKSKRVKTAVAKPGSLHPAGSTLSQCFVEHAARETCWMREHAKECEYQAAHDAGVRRGVWLHCALLAQERKA